MERLNGSYTKRIPSVYRPQHSTQHEFDPLKLSHDVCRRDRLGAEFACISTKKQVRSGEGGSSFTPSERRDCEVSGGKPEYLEYIDR